VARFIVLEHASPAAVRAATTELTADGARIVTGWRTLTGVPASRAVCVGQVRCADDAVRSVLAAVAGSRLVVDADAPREVLDQLCDDLRRLGDVDHRVEPTQAPELSGEQGALLARLLAGDTLGEAARALHISRRTADRRLAGAREALGVDSTPAALRLAAQLGIARPHR
jgi:DNA-binding CsgD family transcriptional regulator